MAKGLRGGDGRKEMEMLQLLANGYLIGVGILMIVLGHVVIGVCTIIVGTLVLICRVRELVLLEAILSKGKQLASAMRRTKQ